jgi:hypothetical protein
VRRGRVEWRAWWGLGLGFGGEENGVPGGGSRGSHSAGTFVERHSFSGVGYMCQCTGHRCQSVVWCLVRREASSSTREGAALGVARRTAPPDCAPGVRDDDLPTAPSPIAHDAISGTPAKSSVSAGGEASRAHALSCTLAPLRSPGESAAAALLGGRVPVAARDMLTPRRSLNPLSTAAFAGRDPRDPRQPDF